MFDACIMMMIVVFAAQEAEGWKIDYDYVTTRTVSSLGFVIYSRRVENGCVGFFRLGQVLTLKEKGTSLLDS
jgi:hypothetical protein